MRSSRYAIGAIAAVAMAFTLCSHRMAYCQNPEWAFIPEIKDANVIIDGGTCIWVGRETGLTRIDKGTGEIESFTPENSGLPDTTVRALDLDHSGNLWIVTPGRLTMFDGAVWTTYSQDFLHNVAVDDTGGVWVLGRFLLRFDGSEFHELAKPDDFLSVKDIEIGPSGSVWLTGVVGRGHWGALAWYDGARWAVRKIGEMLTSFAIDSTGEVWTGSMSGVLIYDGAEWSTYHVWNSGLLHNFVHSIAVDEQNVKWIGTYKGLSRYDGQNWAAFEPPTGDSLRISVGGVIVDALGHKWMTTYPGLAIFREGGVAYDHWVPSHTAPHPKPEAAPVRHVLYETSPNPFRVKTRITFDVAYETSVTLVVQNIRGQALRTVSQSAYGPGHYEVTWDGTDGKGAPVAAGVYILRLTADSYSATRKLVLLR